MKLRITENAMQTTLKAVLFVCLTAFIVHFYPSVSSRFPYYFEIGKPWRYGLMTAEFDFPVYKSDRQLKEEQDAALADFAPYFTLDPGVVETQLDGLRRDVAADEELHGALMRYLENCYRRIYNRGIVQAAALDDLQRNRQTEVMVVDDKRSASRLAADQLYTPKTAYEAILHEASAQQRQALNKVELNRYLAENLRFDSLTTAAAREECLKNISLTQGLVQAGERIVDKGEIVTESTYQILTSLKRAYSEQQISSTRAVLVVAGEVALTIVFLLLLFLYLYLFRPQIFAQWNNLLFMTLMVAVIVFLAAMVMRYTQWSVYVVPFAILPVVVRVFFDSRTALFTHWTTVLLVALMTPAPVEFILLEVAAGMAAVSSLKDLTLRSQLARTSLWLFAVYAVLFTALQLIQGGSFAEIDPWYYLYFALSSFMLLLSYGFIYLFERMFGFISSITLVELTNVNSDLMLRFAEVAPGTFQHSLQVSNLATEAAKKVGANALLVRTGALYHDIGKMEHPDFFTENQNGHNPLNDMPLPQAAQTIINHVSDGLRIAHKEHLPKIITHFIETHHGTSRTGYFYNTYCNQHPGEAVDAAPFTYPGPSPDSKETAILMMADSVEAASRSLKEVTEESLATLITKIIDGQMANGQFKNTPLTFKDVEDIKAVLLSKLISMNHHRIVYPELKEKGERREVRGV